VLGETLHFLSGIKRSQWKNDEIGTHTKARGRDYTICFLFPHLLPEPDISLLLVLVSEGLAKTDDFLRSASLPVLLFPVKLLLGLGGAPGWLSPH